MPGPRRQCHFPAQSHGGEQAGCFSSVQFAAATGKKGAMKVIGIIPARYGSTRFPGKPLALIAGKPLIRHVVERCQQAKSLAEVIVATDDTRIWEVVWPPSATEPNGPPRQPDQ